MSKHLKILSISAILIFVIVAFIVFRDKSEVIHPTSSPKEVYYPDPTILGITNSLSDSSSYSEINKSIEQFVRKWGLAGASVAIARNGKLIYAHGFGYANKEDKKVMQPYNRMRIASVSKLITATAIMKLVESGKLQLSSKVFGKNGILNDPVFLNYKDNRVEDITVNNLLNHSGGWTSRWGDHMFIKEIVAKELNKELPVTLTDIVVFALSKKLHFAPGDHCSYSNLGYGILQLVIEKVAGLDYEKYVQQNLFAPLNIHDAYLSENWDSLRHKNEVRYYEVPEAELITAFDGSTDKVLKCRGGNDVHTLGAAGGWVISSVNLTKFILAIDGNKSFPDILKKKSVARMAVSDKKFQPLGWRWVMANGKLWRSGSLAGTTALAVSKSDGYTYVFISNSSPWKGARFPYIIDRFMDKIVQKADKLPNRDLFYHGISSKN
ncbi:MAG: serine hydrolase domain-containing protein [Bacteroidales bacterium]